MRPPSVAIASVTPTAMCARPRSKQTMDSAESIVCCRLRMTGEGWRGEAEDYWIVTNAMIAKFQPRPAKLEARGAEQHEWMPLLSRYTHKRRIFVAAHPEDRSGVNRFLINSAQVQRNIHAAVTRSKKRYPTSLFRATNLPDMIQLCLFLKAEPFSWLARSYSWRALSGLKTRIRQHPAR